MSIHRAIAVFLLEVRVWSGRCPPVCIYLGGLGCTLKLVEKRGTLSVRCARFSLSVFYARHGELAAKLKSHDAKR